MFLHRHRRHRRRCQRLRRLHHPRPDSYPCCPARDDLIVPHPPLGGACVDAVGGPYALQHRHQNRRPRHRNPLFKETYDAVQ